MTVVGIACAVFRAAAVGHSDRCSGVTHSHDDNFF